jgi:xanthine dehydrogenase small subunit
LNEKEIACTRPPGMTLLDFIRYEQNLKGTKIGCREGDCGACTVLVGSLQQGRMQYKSMTSCLLPLGNVQGNHIVTIEGVNLEQGQLNQCQQAMSDEGATQCGFCTPGFIVSLAGFCLGDKLPTKENAIAAMDGNICRCTGYKSIERAAGHIATKLEQAPADKLEFLVANNFLPSHFKSVAKKIAAFQGLNGEPEKNNPALKKIGGGTDLYVQQADALINADLQFLSNDEQLKGIVLEKNLCVMGSAVTVSDLKQSTIFRKIFPKFDQYAKLVSSTPIRNMATIGGNFVNASPIGDFTIFFLALGATVHLRKGNEKRSLYLRDLYTGYKQLAKEKDELIEKISFPLPSKNDFFNFEKISKRTHLDIASVNTAISISIENNNITKATLSAGGVGPVPLLLSRTSIFLEGKSLGINDWMEDLLKIARSEIAPISDARGSSDYKYFLLCQLIRAHFEVLKNERAALT